MGPTHDASVRSNDDTSVIPTLDWNCGAEYGWPRGVIHLSATARDRGAVMSALGQKQTFWTDRLWISRFVLAQLPIMLTQVTLLWGLSRWRGKGEKHPLANAGNPEPRSERRLGLG